MVTGHNPGMVEQQNNVLDAALKAGAKYLVRVGGGRAVASADSESVVGRGHAAIEERLRDSGIKWVILRPGLFMQNVLGQAASIKNDSKMVLPFAKDLPVALIDVRDTGAVGARILIDPAPHAGKTYEFTGKLTSYGDIRRGVLAGARPDDHLCRDHARAGRAGHEVARHAGLAVRASGHRSPSSARTAASRPRTPSSIEDLVKRAPITTKQFVEDFKALFV